MKRRVRKIRVLYKYQKRNLKWYRVRRQREREIKEASMTNIKGRIKNNFSGFLRILVLGLLVLLQIMFILTMPLLLRQYTTAFYFILEIASFFVTLGLVNANKSTSYKIAWMAIALLLPVSGHIMYFLWGRKAKRKKIFIEKRKRLEQSYPYILFDEECENDFYKENVRLAGLSKYLKSFKLPLYRNNKIKYYSFGEDVFEDIFADIDKAKKFILINFFIVAEGALWDIMHAKLLDKVKQGVEVIFIYDDFGGMIRTDKHFCDRLNKEGIRTITFNPIHRYTDKLIMNYRTHQKIVVIDGNIGYTGGFNLADEYANLIERFGRWKDCGIRVRGDAVWGLTMTFLQVFSMCCPKEDIDYQKYRPTMDFPENNNYIHVLSDGPYISEENIIETAYREIITTADKFVYIMTPYLILDESMIQAICMAVRKGVDVRIITPKIPDKKSVYMLTKYNYGQLLKAGARIYEYTPGFIHSKVVLSDSCAMVGTVNMDYRSFYLHFENAVLVAQPDILGDVLDDFNETFEISQEVSYEEWLNRPFKEKLLQPVYNLFSTLV